MPESKVTILQKPQINISVPSAGRMWLVCFCAFLCVLQSAFSDGGRTLIIAFTAFFSALFIELLLTWRKYRAEKIKDGSAAATAMILSILLPNQIHPVFVFLGAAFAVLVVKYSFGGLGANWLNPALGGWLFIRFSWPSAFTNAFNGSTPSISEMIIAPDISKLDSSVTDFFNGSIFSIAGVQLPSGYIDLLFNNNACIITDRGLFFLLIGTIVITAVGINRGWVPLVFLAIYGFLIRFAGDLSETYWNGDMLYGIFSGGTIAAAFILAAEPASGAKLTPGLVFTTVLSAFLSWLFRYRCMDYTGCLIAIALTNCLTPLIRLFEEKVFLSSRSNRGKFQENRL
ncbi:electron transport complex protein RnfD [Treponema sp. R8-4-B8]